MSDSDIQLVINKEFNVPVERVYSAWTQPEILKKWFMPGPGMKVADAEVDLTPGGSYTIHMLNIEENSDHIVSGTYEEIIPNEKIVFDWMWKGGVEKTKVTIEFVSKGEEHTQVVLTHQGFSTQELSDKHVMGWNGCLATLENHFSH